MYKPGDHVFYPKGGVFVIEKESQKDIAGHSISFFDLISSDAKTRISIPKANVDRVGVRKLVTEQEFDRQVKGWIPDIKISKLHHKNRKSRFETMRQTGTFNEMGSVIVTIHYLINKTKATFEEKRMYDQIRKRLVNEIEIIKSMNPSSAESLLQGALDVAIKRKPAKEEEPEAQAVTLDEKPAAPQDQKAKPEAAKATAETAAKAEEKTEKQKEKAAPKAKEKTAVKTVEKAVPKSKEKAAAKPKEKATAKAVEKPVTKQRKTTAATKAKTTTKATKATAVAG